MENDSQFFSYLLKLSLTFSVKVPIVGAQKYTVSILSTLILMQNWGDAIILATTVRAGHKEQTWYAQFPSCCAANMELCRYISVHQPSAEISSGLDSNPTSSSAPTYDFFSLQELGPIEEWTN